MADFDPSAMPHPLLHPVRFGRWWRAGFVAGWRTGAEQLAAAKAEAAEVRARADHLDRVGAAFDAVVADLKVQLVADLDALDRQWADDRVGRYQAKVRLLATYEEQLRRIGDAARAHAHG